jgi:uncharacterized membrane protein
MICRTLESSERREHRLYISSMLALGISSIVAVSTVTIIGWIISHRVAMIAGTIATDTLLLWGVL